MTLQNLLKEYQQAGNLIKVGLVGAGQMGEGLICQMEKMYGMRAFAVADVVPNRAVQAFQSANLPDDQIVETNRLDLAVAAIEEGRRLATNDSSLLAQIPNLDIIVEATGIPEIGARVALDAILNRK